MTVGAAKQYQSSTMPGSLQTTGYAGAIAAALA
jgi:hypothetical protein